MTTFGLVHGAYHGAWCWQPLIDELDCGHSPFISATSLFADTLLGLT
ncbi:MAG TPA: hypothetical protein VHB02_05395 [Acidimicrobiales bacterium]|nr:hypothetical protein [Acidimicrobiales bacterium]